MWDKNMICYFHKSANILITIVVDGRPLQCNIHKSYKNRKSIKLICLSHIIETRQSKQPYRKWQY